MAERKPVSKEESLDPDSWESLRTLGHQMVDDMMAYLQTVRERPVWQPVPEKVREHLKQPLPQEPCDSEQVYKDFQQFVLPHATGNIHPRFWGWVQGTGTPSGVLAEMLAAAMNSNVLGGDQGPVYVENQVLNWCKEMLGYPAGASGLLVSGGSMANFVCLTVARNAMADIDLAQHGLHAAPRQMTVYSSSEVHSSSQRAIELLGLGRDALRKAPVNADYQVDVEALKTMIVRDRARGYYPFCVIGNAGTVNTGAMDDLNRLADLCQTERMWFHVDGAFGALAALSPRLRPMLAGMERADSLAFDLHKWMYVPYEAGCVLIRHEGEHHRAFVPGGAYLTHASGGFAVESTWFSEYGVQLSRGFRALKIWMSIKEHGIRKYARLIEQNVEQARYLAELIAAAPELELLAPVPLNIVCFRFKDECLSHDQLNDLNKELLIQLQESGVAVPSHTTLDGRFAIRVAITNHRSRREDFDLLVQKVLEIGKRLK